VTNSRFPQAKVSANDHFGLWKSLVAGLVVLGLGACADDAESPAIGAAPDQPLTGPQGRVGQFAVDCPWSHSAFDDPIVHPGHEGASHRHDFFGNTGTDADSTYETLIEGETTCTQRLDTATYWAPSLLDADGSPIEPVSATAYYRAGAGVDAATVAPYPAGLMMVAGDASAEAPQPTSVVAWACGASGARRERPAECPEGVGPRLLVTFPDCWDGERTDSDDHRSHVAYSHQGSCPTDHPTPIPQLQFAIDYPPVGPDGLSLASGDIVTAHADFWNTWDQHKLATEVDACLHRRLVCSLG
jgi:hypothetical protein